MQKSKIEWTDYVFNPIKGACPVDCKLPDGRSYCYARKIYKRFTPQWRGWNGTDEPFILADEFVQLDKLKKPSKIFVCSTFELFHPSVKKHIHWVFNAIEKNPQHTFQILTKFPQNIDRPMPDNVWLGVTVTGCPGRVDRNRLDVFQDIKAKIKFISYEPILGEMSFEEKDKIDWLIMGALTGCGYKNRYRPDIIFLQILAHSYQRDGTKIFIKSNLKETWGEPLIQEFPND